MAHDKQVDQIMDGLAGDFQIGKKYFFFTVTFHYIGTIEKVTDSVIYLDSSSATIVMNAGGETDAVSQIVQGKKKPEVSEKPGETIMIMRQALTAVIPMKK